MDAMDSKFSMIVSRLTGQEQVVQKEDAINVRYGRRLPTPSVTEASL